MNTETRAENGTQDSTGPETKKKRTIFSYLKWIPLLLLLLVVGLALMIIMRFRNDATIPYDVSTEGITIPAYDVST